MRLVIVPPLTDAYFYLNQAKGLPSIPSAEPLRGRYVTSCIFLSRVAVEAALVDRFTELQRNHSISRDRPRRISESLSILLARDKKKLNEAEFKRLRRIRNEVAHPKADDHDNDVTLDLASETFLFCAGVIEDMYHPIRLMYTDFGPR